MSSIASHLQLNISETV